MNKVAVITAWRYRDHFIPVYNEIWSKQTYTNYDIHIFEENYTLDQKKNKFNNNFIIHSIPVGGRLSIGAKLNYAFRSIDKDKYDFIMLSSSDDYYSHEYISVCANFMLQNRDIDIINMHTANYINLNSMHTTSINTSQSYSGMFFFKSKLLNYTWNERLRAGEDRYMLNLWKKNGIKHISTNIHQKHWLGIIHTDNWNTRGRGWRWRKIDNSWLESYINNSFISQFYINLIPKK